MECLSDQTATHLQEYDKFNANARMQVVVILEVADIESNSRTFSLPATSPSGTKVVTAIDEESGARQRQRFKISGANILLGSSVSFWVQCIPNGCPLPLRSVPPQWPTFLDAPIFAVDDASPRLPYPVIT